MTKYVEMKSLSANDRQSAVWLNTDDVLKILPIGRSSLWKYVEEEKFPIPYKWKGAMYWSQSSVDQWILDRVAGVNNNGSRTIPITWAKAIKYLKSCSPCWVTTKNVANELNADRADTTYLLNLMHKAGELDKFVEGTANLAIYRISKENQ